MFIVETKNEGKKKEYLGIYHDIKTAERIKKIFEKEENISLMIKDFKINKLF